MRIRLPLAPAMLRAGGWISAGIISTVHTPFPIFAATVAKDCAHFCAPSPESLMTSTMCSLSSMACFPYKENSIPQPFDESCSAMTCLLLGISTALGRLHSNTDQVALFRSDPKQPVVPSRCRVVNGVAIHNPQKCLDAARGLSPGAHGFDDRGGAGDNVAAGINACQGRGQVLVRRNVPPFVQPDIRGLPDDRIGLGADGVDHHARLEFVLASRDRHRTPPSGLVRLAQFHAD